MKTNYFKSLVSWFYNSSFPTNCTSWFYHRILCFIIIREANSVDIDWSATSVATSVAVQSLSTLVAIVQLSKDLRVITVLCEVHAMYACLRLYQ